MILHMAGETAAEQPFRAQKDAHSQADQKITK